jgi:hypothetical protein
MINGACGIRFKPAGDEPRLAARFTADQLHWGGRTAAPDEARRRLVSAAPRPLGQHRRLTPHAWRDRQAQVGAPQRSHREAREQYLEQLGTPKPDVVGAPAATTKSSTPS